MISIRNEGSSDIDDTVEVLPSENAFVKFKLNRHHFDPKQMATISGYSVCSVGSVVSNQISSVIGSSILAVNEKITSKKEMETYACSLYASIRRSEEDSKKLLTVNKRLGLELNRMRSKVSEIRSSLIVNKNSIDVQRSMLNEKLANVRQECYIDANKPQQIYNSIIGRIEKISDNKSQFQKQCESMRTESKNISTSLSLASDTKEKLSKHLNQMKKLNLSRSRSVTKHKQLLNGISKQDSSLDYFTSKQHTRNVTGITVSSYTSHNRLGHSLSCSKSVQKIKSIFV
jgi:septal ring factor EnvC (AmiA/AmiB activator)